MGGRFDIVGRSKEEGREAGLNLFDTLGTSSSFDTRRYAARLRMTH